MANWHYIGKRQAKINLIACPFAPVARSKYAQMAESDAVFGAISLYRGQVLLQFRIFGDETHHLFE